MRGSKIEEKNSTGPTTPHIRIRIERNAAAPLITDIPNAAVPLDAISCHGFTGRVNIR